MLDLPVGEVHVWWARPLSQPAWELLLDGTERSRLASYRRPEDQARFLTGTTLVRCLYAVELGVPPARVVLDRSCTDCGRPHGKVRLAGATPEGVQVSVSHAGDWVVVAAFRGRPIGVDVERVDPGLDHLGIGQLALTEGELAALRAVPVERRASWLATSWVRKEAVVKALGEGLRASMAGFTVTAPDAPAGVVSWPSRPDLPRRVRLRDVACDDGHRAAVAVVDAPIVRVVRQDAEALVKVAAN